MTRESMNTKVLTIMFADMVGSTKLSTSLNRGDDMLIKQELRDLFSEHSSNYGGRIVKSVGDGFLVVFKSPTNAVLCGEAVQDALKSWDDESIPHIQFRIGIHTGEVSVDEDGDLYGREVNVASRVESASEPEGVFFSETTFGAMNKTELNFQFVGRKKLKGIDDRIGINKVIPEGQESLTVDEMERRSRIKKWSMAAVGVVLMAALLIGGYAGFGAMTKAPAEVPVIQWEEALSYADRHVKVRGEVVATSDLGGVHTINFGTVHGDLYGVISTSAIDRFPPLDEYVGKTVEIEGVIYRYKEAQPCVNIQSPKQITVVGG